MAEESTSSQILKSTAVSVVKHFLSIGAAYLITKGLVAPEILSEGNLLILAGGVVAGGVSLAWIVRGKLQGRNLVESARELPAGTPMSIVKTDAESKPLIPK